MFNLQIKPWLWKSAALSEYMKDFSQDILQPLKNENTAVYGVWCWLFCDFFPPNFFLQAILLLSQKHTVKHEQHDGREEGLSSAWWGLTYVTIYVNKSEAEKLDSD